MAKLAAIVAFLLHSGKVSAFTPSPFCSSSLSARSSLAFHASSTPNIDLDTNSVDDSSRRSLLSQALAATTLFTLPLVSSADEGSTTVVVAGATGQTGRRILERLASQPNVAVIAGVRNVEKAEKSLSESSTVVRGAMVQKVPSLDAAGVELRRLDGQSYCYYFFFRLRGKTYSH